jgi:hypothetical protein
VLYDLKKPCDNCPFLKVGGVRLSQRRVEEIAGAMLDWNGSTFACHKTTIEVETEEGGDRANGPKTRHCAGALIFAEKHENANQMMRIAERLGMYKPRELMADQAVVDLVFDDLDEMLEVNEEAESGRPRRRKK